MGNRLSDEQIREFVEVSKISKRTTLKKRLIAYSTIVLVFLSSIVLYGVIMWFFENIVGETITHTIATLSLFAFLYFVGNRFKNLWEGHL